MHTITITAEEREALRGHLEWLTNQDNWLRDHGDAAQALAAVLGPFVPASIDVAVPYGPEALWVAFCRDEQNGEDEAVLEP